MPIIKKSADKIVTLDDSDEQLPPLYRGDSASPFIPGAMASETMLLLALVSKAEIDEQEDNSLPNFGLFLEKGSNPEIIPVYRGDRLAPSNAFQSSFTASSTNTDVIVHVCKNGGGFVSTSTSMDVAIKYALGRSTKPGLVCDRFVYEICSSKEAIDPSEALLREFSAGRLNVDDFKKYTADQEWLEPLSVKKERIKGAWRIKEMVLVDGKPTVILDNNYIPNPHYVPPLLKVTKALKGLGRSAAAVGVVMDGMSLHAAYVQSQENDNYEPLLDEGARVFGGWSGAYALGAALGRAGAFAGAKVGPTPYLKSLFSLVGGVVFGAAGSIAGYNSGGKFAQWLIKYAPSQSEVYKPILNIPCVVSYHDFFEKDDIRAGYLIFSGDVRAPSLQERMAFDPNYLTELHKARWQSLAPLYSAAQDTAVPLKILSDSVIKEMAPSIQDATSVTPSGTTVSTHHKEQKPIDYGAFGTTSKYMDNGIFVGATWTPPHINCTFEVGGYVDLKGLERRIQRFLDLACEGEGFIEEVRIAGDDYYYSITPGNFTTVITFYEKKQNVKPKYKKWQTVDEVKKDYRELKIIECKMPFFGYIGDSIISIFKKKFVAEKTPEEIIKEALIEEFTPSINKKMYQRFAEFSMKFNAALSANDPILAEQLNQELFDLYHDVGTYNEGKKQIDNHNKQVEEQRLAREFANLVDQVNATENVEQSYALIDDWEKNHSQKIGLSEDLASLRLHVANKNAAAIRTLNDINQKLIQEYEEAEKIRISVLNILTEHDVSVGESSEKLVRALRIYRDDTNQLLMQEIFRSHETEKRLLTIIEQIKTKDDGNHNIRSAQLIDLCERQLNQLKQTRRANELEVQLCDLKRENFRWQIGILITDLISFCVRKYEKYYRDSDAGPVVSAEHLITSLRSPLFKSLQTHLNKSVVTPSSTKLPRPDSDGHSSLERFKAICDLISGCCRIMSDDCQREMTARILGVGNDPSCLNCDEMASARQFLEGLFSLLAHSPLGSMVNVYTPDSLKTIYQVVVPFFKALWSESPEELLQLPVVKNGLKLSESTGYSDRARYLVTDLLFYLTKKDKVTQGIILFYYFQKYARTLSAGVEIMTGQNYLNAANQLASISIKGTSVALMIPVKIGCWVVDRFYLQRDVNGEPETFLPIMIQGACNLAPFAVNAVTIAPVIAPVIAAGVTHFLPEALLTAIASMSTDVIITAGAGTAIVVGYKYYVHKWYQSRIENVKADLKSGQIEKFLMAGRRITELRASYPEDALSQQLMQVITDSAAILNRELGASAKTALEQYISLHAFAAHVIKASDDIKQQYSMNGLRKIQQQLQSTYTMYGQQHEWWISQLKHFAESVKALQQLPEDLPQTLCQFKLIHQDLNNAIEFILKYHVPSSAEREALEVLKASYNEVAIALQERHIEFKASDLTAEISQMDELLKSDEFKRLEPLIDERHQESLRYLRRQVTSQLSTHLVIMGLEYVFETLRTNRSQPNRRLPHWSLPAKTTQSDFPIPQKSRPEVLLTRKKMSSDSRLCFQKQPEKTSPLHLVRSLQSSESSALFFKSSKTQPDFFNRGVSYAGSK